LLLLQRRLTNLLPFGCGKLLLLLLPAFSCAACCPCSWPIEEAVKA
jgi:hypothetical protein